MSARTHPGVSPPHPLVVVVLFLVSFLNSPSDVFFPSEVLDGGYFGNARTLVAGEALPFVSVVMRAALKRGTEPLNTLILGVRIQFPICMDSRNSIIDNRLVKVVGNGLILTFLIDLAHFLVVPPALVQLVLVRT
mmetsp:Transcript_5880/g.5304  ORF Transcript_5880/g.5304 Transcript_5880/m.5304 type:complete len:135 (+) Transcript_5880:113-517(+)